MGKVTRRRREAASAAMAPATSPAPAPSPIPAATVQGPPWVTRALLWILAAAALFRVAYFFQYRAHSVFFSTPFLDAWIYDDWARRIAAGQWLPSEPFYFAPGYPYVLALFYKCVSTSLEGVYVAQFLLGLLNIVLIHRLAALAFGRRPATAAAALAALYASFPFLEAKVMSPTLALTFLLASMVALAEAASRGGWFLWSAAGLLLGATSLARPETLLAAPFLLAWVWRWGRPPDRGGWKGTILAAAAVAAGWAVAIAPAAAHNVLAGGGATLISSQGGITFYQSNNPRARGLYVYLSREGFSGAPEKQAQEEKAIAEKALGRPLTGSEVSSYWFGRGLKFIRERPGRFLWLLGMKLLRFVGSYEYSTEYIIYVERETVWLLWIPFVPFALLAALAVPSIGRGILASRNARSPARPGALNDAGWLMIVLLAANLATVLIFYVSSRYRLPSAPPMIVFAGATVVGVLEAVRGARKADAWATIAVVGLIFLLFHFEKDDSATIQEANVHYNSGNLWLGKRDLVRAETEYRRAIAMDSSRYEFYYNLGNALRDQGRPAEAAEMYGLSARRRPAFFNARLRRCQMLVEAADWAGAQEACRAAEEVRPDEFEVHLALGRIAARRGDRAEALRHLDRALEIRPDSQAAREERARL